MRKLFLIVSLVVVFFAACVSFVWKPFFWSFLFIVPCVAIGLYDSIQTKHSLRRNFPLVGRGRWLMEFVRPFVRQYLMESDTDGVPISRMFRSVVYQRAKGVRDTVPFGTKVDTYRIGYEWIAHSMAAESASVDDEAPRVVVGGANCSQPYSASLLNISAMSFGSLSKNAIIALNKGAKLGQFAHNTGEGGATPYHLETGGDVIWQLGTGYFGARAKSGGFDPTQFADTSSHPNIKMIEIKMSQGAKPGHGGILPAAKNTPEIARIRGVDPHTTVDSPPAHSAFGNPLEMMHFIQQLRELSGGKPVGFKFCVGRGSEVIALCKAMVETGIKPDFITVDGGEGGTGAAPLEFTNSIGMPLREGLAFVCDSLSGFDLKHEVRVIAAGKIFSAFHMIKNIAIGADLTYSARGMMLALGCVQSLICNTNHCPTGVATQDPKLSQGLDVTDKSVRVARFHAETMERFVEILAASGLSDTSQLNRSYIHRRLSQATIARYDEIFPYVEAGCFLTGDIPDRFSHAMKEGDATSFRPTNSVALYHGGLRPLNVSAPT